MPFPPPPPPGLPVSGITVSLEEDDDAALIDSFFLPGGILDPDDDEPTTTNTIAVTNDMSRLASLPPSGFGFLSINPWSNERLLSTIANSVITNNNVQLEQQQPHLQREVGSGISRPSGYSSRLDDHFFFSSEPQNPKSPTRYLDIATAAVKTNATAVIQETPSELKKSHEPKDLPGDALSTHDYHPRLPQHQLPLHSSLSLDPSDEVPLPSTVPHTTIDRRRHVAPPKSSGKVMMNGASGMDSSENRPWEDIPTATYFNEEGETPVLRILPRKVQTTPIERSNPYMAFVEYDDSSQSSSSSMEDINPQRSLAANVISTAGPTHSEMKEAKFLGLDVNVNEDGGDNNHFMYDSTSDNEGPFPIDSLVFLKASTMQDSMTSSVSSSNEDSDPDESRRNANFRVEEDDRLSVDSKYEEEGTVVPNSEVAVIVDVAEDVHAVQALPRASRTVENCTMGESNNLMTSKKVGNPQVKAQSPRKGQNNTSTTTSNHALLESLSSQSAESTLWVWGRLKALKTFFMSILPFTEVNFLEGIKDLAEVLAMLTLSSWKSIRRILGIANKVLTIALLSWIQLWKFAFLEVIEEPRVAFCYALFYFLPYGTFLLMESFILPHWTPNFLTSMAVWFLSTSLSGGPLHRFPIKLQDIPWLLGLAAEHDNVPLESHIRDERLCKAILRGLRYLVVVFFIFDGFSSEFGTILSANGSTRLTSAFMMSLVRKNSVSSPIGWVSWAVQVLISTYLPAVLSLELVVLLSGLSSIRLIRYLEAQLHRGGNRDKND